MNKIKNFQKHKSFIFSYVVMAFIPIVVCSLFFYPQLYRRIFKQTNDEAASEARKVLGELDQQQQIISNIPNRLFENPNIKRMDLERPWENLKAYVEIRNMIATNKNIKDCFLFIRDTDYFISGYQGNISLEKLEEYGGTIAFSYDAWNTKEIVRELDEVRTPFWRTAESVRMLGHEQKNVLTYVSSVPMNNRFAPWAVIVLIDAERLIEGTKETGETADGYLLFSADNELLYKSAGIRNEVCSYLVDMGAEKIRQEQTLRFEGDTLINVVQSEASGWMLVKVSDLGPMVSQLRSLELKFLLTLLSMVFVLSVLGNYFIQINFRPIQQIRDMLIKTEKESKRGLDNHKYYQEIEQAIRILQTDNERMQFNLNQTRPRIRQHLFSEILSGSSLSKVKRNMDELIEIDSGVIADCYAVAVFHAEESELLKRVRDCIFGKGRREKNRFLFAELYNRNSMAVVLAEPECIPDFMDKIIAECRKEGDSALQAGVGEIVPGMSELSASYSQACAALDYAMLNSVINTAICYSELPDSVFKGHSYPLELIDSFAFAVRMNKKEDVQAAVQQIIYMMQMTKVSPYYIRSLFFNVISIFMEDQKVYRKYEKEASDISVMLSKQLSSAEMIEVIRNCYELFTREKEDDQKKENEWMKQVKDYIDMHAGESSLSLVEVSEHIGMSSTWFSTLFKEKGGCSFKEYVDMVRLEKARDLLTTTEATVEVVAEKVGYNNSYSFTRFFKKYTGVTPNAYRLMKKDTIES